jgi:hypothetical protein
VSLEILIAASIALGSLLEATRQAWMLRRSECVRTQLIVVVEKTNIPADPDAGDLAIAAA